MVSNLSVSQNKLETIPDAIGNLTKLEDLTLGKNPFQALPIRELEELPLSDSSRKRLRNVVGTMKN